MQIRIFQLRNDFKDKFMSYEHMMNNGGINAEDYRQVYGGDILIPDLNGALNTIYEICNIGERPLGYMGHSLSVSDIIEIREWNSFFFVDSFGFKKLDNFDIDKTNHGQMIRVLICECERHPYIAEIPDDYKALQHIVGGHFETFPVDPKEKLIAWCNDEGLINGSKLNRIINGNPIYGNLCISSLSDNLEDMASIAPEQSDSLTSALYYPAISNTKEGF